jgi:hypothetical protein
MTLQEVEKKGLELLASKPVKSDKDVLGDVGLFGVQMAVIGLGVEVFSKPSGVGAGLMKLGALLGVVGYGARAVL